MSTYIPQRFCLLSYDSSTRVSDAFETKCNDFSRPIRTLEFLDLSLGRLEW